MPHSSRVTTGSVVPTAVPLPPLPVPSPLLPPFFLFLLLLLFFLFHFPYPFLFPHYIALTRFELERLLPQPFKCKNYKCKPQCIALTFTAFYHIPVLGWVRVSSSVRATTS